jgi:ABC-type oligopeptide transport system substrate-binding subunit
MPEEDICLFVRDRRDKPICRNTGTGPFRSVRRVENEVWVMEKNPNYWNKGLPYLDVVFHAPQMRPYTRAPE